MISLGSIAGVLADVRTAKTVFFAGYLLPPGAMERALADAARSGARVIVRLEGQPFGSSAGAALANQDAVQRLRAAGADARLVHEPGSSDSPLHVKALATESALYLDDRNFAGSDEQTILRDDAPADRNAFEAAVEGNAIDVPAGLALYKHDALALEAALLRTASQGDDVAVESESLGSYNSVYGALDAIARNGGSPRLIVTAATATKGPEASAIARLASDGVQIRLSTSTEKFALVNDRAWTGSANASAAFDRPDQIDWGLQTDDSEIVALERARFESRWLVAKPYAPTAN